MSKLHCANCGRPWTATDGDNGCCWNESLCALVTLRRSPPAPAIDVEGVVREKAKLADEYAEILIQIRDEDGDLYGWTDEHQGISIVGMEIADARDWLARYEALRAALGGKEQRG